MSERISEYILCATRLLSVLHQLSGTTMDGASYSVDAVGNRTAKTNQQAQVTSNYSYDALYQLTQVAQNSGATDPIVFDPYTFIM